MNERMNWWINENKWKGEWVNNEYEWTDEWVNKWIWKDGWMGE